MPRSINRLTLTALVVFIIALVATVLVVEFAEPSAAHPQAYSQVRAVNAATTDSVTFLPAGGTVANKALVVPTGDHRALVTADVTVTGWLDVARRDQEPSLTARLSIGGETGPDCLSAGADVGTPSTAASCTYAAVVNGTGPITVDVWASGLYLAARTGSVQLTVTEVAVP